MWRGSVHEWNQYHQRPKRLRLGPYQAQLRQYLLGNSDFPPNMSLVVTVISTISTERNAKILFPWFTEKHDGYHKYAFVIPGVTFQLFVGKNFSRATRECCLVQSPDNQCSCPKNGRTTRSERWPSFT